MDVEILSAPKQEEFPQIEEEIEQWVEHEDIYRKLLQMVKDNEVDEIDEFIKRNNDYKIVDEFKILYENVIKQKR